MDEQLQPQPHSQTQPHILLVTYPAQGHINPALQFAKRLVRIGVHVTFVTTDSAIRRVMMNKATTTISKEDGLTFSAIFDGYQDGFKHGVHDVHHYMNELRCQGSKTLKDLILTAANEGTRYTHIVYSILIPWVSKVAREVNIPSTLLWNQTATTFDIYHHYFNGYEEIIKKYINEDPLSSIKLPGLPELTTRDFPSFFSPTDIKTFVLPLFKEDLHVITVGDEGSIIKAKVLVNTFDKLEPEALKVCDKYNLIGIGPLVPSAFLDGSDPSNTSSGADLFKNSSRDYMEWLDQKDERSVVYVSFGSITELSKSQMEEMAKGLIDYGRPFLWVIRGKENIEEDDEFVTRYIREELLRKGKIVGWCSQVEVLSHPSVGCFVTHCGWNSTLESLCSGVPMVGFPQWTDQCTNSKMMADVWKIGVRVDLNRENMVEGDEFKRCLELVMGDGERGKEMRNNAKIWKELARDAAKQGGSSDKNLKAFVDHIRP